MLPIKGELKVRGRSLLGVSFRASLGKFLFLSPVKPSKEEMFSCRKTLSLVYLTRM